MSNATVDVIAPRELIIPQKIGSAQTTTASTGTIGMSGSNLMLYDGATWDRIASAPPDNLISGQFTTLSGALQFSGGLLIAVL